MKSGTCYGIPVFFIGKDWRGIDMYLVKGKVIFSVDNLYIYTCRLRQEAINSGRRI